MNPTLTKIIKTVANVCNIYLSCIVPIIIKVTIKTNKITNPISPYLELY